MLIDSLLFSPENFPLFLNFALAYQKQTNKQDLDGRSSNLPSIWASLFNCVLKMMD